MTQNSESTNLTQRTVNRRNVLKAGVASTIGVAGFAQTASAQTECTSTVTIWAREIGGGPRRPLTCAEEDGCPALDLTVITNDFDVGVEEVRVWGDSCEGQVMLTPDHTRETGECPHLFRLILQEGPGDVTCFEVGSTLHILLRYCESCQPSKFTVTVPDFGEQVRVTA